MSGFFQSIKTTYDGVLVGISPEVDEWPLMKSPLPVLSILGIYLYFILKFGPNYMKNRKPYNLRWILIIYNAYQVLFSAWLCSQVFQISNYSQYVNSFVCDNKSQDLGLASDFLNGTWWFFFSKIIDLLDTVFFVLRKKQNQVTFLHVYHHFITCFFSWGYLKYLPGEQGALLGFLNSCVHVVMYFYYFLAALGPQYQKYLWWKKYMTWIQLGQFIIMLVYLTIIVMFDCKFHRSLTFFFVVNVCIFLTLFANFYRKAYAKKPTGLAQSVVDIDRRLKKE